MSVDILKYIPLNKSMGLSCNCSTLQICYLCPVLKCFTQLRSV